MNRPPLITPSALKTERMARSKVHLLELLENANAVLLEEEYHDALVGHSVGANPRAIYDVEKILSIEQARTGWKKEDCWDWLEYNLFPEFNPSQRVNHPIFLYPYY